MPKATLRDTRSEILQLTRELTQTRGFNWLSYQDLADRLQIRKASIHYYFPTKTDLGIEVVKEYRKLFAEWREKLSEKKQGPEAELAAYFEMFKKIFGPGDRVCAGGALSLDWNTLPPEMQKEVLIHFEDHHAFLRRRIGTIKRAQKKTRASGKTNDQVALISAALQGALQIARVSGASDPINAAIRELKRIYLGAA